MPRKVEYLCNKNMQYGDAEKLGIYRIAKLQW